MRTPKQVRLETCFHEAGHIVAGHLTGRTIERVWVWSEERLEGLPQMVERGDLDAIGQVAYAPTEILTIGDAVDDIVCSLAGDVGAKLAWALGVVTDEQYGVVDIPTAEIPLEDLAAVSSNGRTPAEKASSLAVLHMPGRGDRANANAVAAQFTDTPHEQALLTAFCTVRAANLIQSERGQRLLGTIAGALEEFGEMTGSHVHDLLDRVTALVDASEGEGP